MMERLIIAHLPDQPLAAHSMMLRDHMAEIEAHMEKGADLAVLLPPCGPDHHDWRIAMARDLAREFAPLRVNILDGGGAAARDAALAYLENAHGVTGQYLPLND